MTGWIRYALAAGMLALGAAGCRRDPPAMAVEEAGPGAPSTLDASAEAAASAADGGFAPDVQALFPRDAVRVAGPFAWPKGGKSAFATAGTMYFAWSYDGRSGTAFTSSGRTPTGAAVKDVDGDGTAELVVFLAPPPRPLEPYEDRATVWIYGLRPDGQPARMGALEHAFLGAHDGPSLDSEVAARGTLGPTKGVAAERLVVRLGWATLEEVKTLIGPAGLKTCSRKAARRTCTAKPTAEIDDATAKRIAGTFAKYESDDPKELGPPLCVPEGSIVRCSANLAAANGSEWVFAKEVDGALRLVEIGTWADET